MFVRGTQQRIEGIYRSPTDKFVRRPIKEFFRGPLEDLTRFFIDELNRGWRKSSKDL